MTDLSHAPNARTLASFFSGECSASESRDVLRWAQSSPECAAWLRELQSAWEEGSGPRVGGVGTWDPDEIWSAIAPRLDEEERRPLRLVVPSRRIPQVQSFGDGRGRNVAAWAAAAACAALLIGLFADQRVARERARQTPPVRVTVREYRTDRGQRASVTLPDGSAFQLGPLSVLRVSSAYGAPDRAVELEGDGYFNVTHDPGRPFSVRTARTTIRDIGTRFIVRARSTEQRVEVAVADGKVSIESGSNRAAVTNTAGTRRDAGIGRRMVGAGQVAFVDERGMVTLVPRASVATRFAWTRGELVFHRVLVPTVLAELSRWYGETFVLGDTTLKTVRLTTVLRGETLSEALLVLETALDVDAHVSGDTVRLTRHTDEQ